MRQTPSAAAAGEVDDGPVTSDSSYVKWKGGGGGVISLQSQHSVFSPTF